MTLFSFWRTDQWAISNASQETSSNDVEGLDDYTHVQVNQ